MTKKQKITVENDPKPMLPAKLMRPLTRRVVPRERLFQLIDTGREQKIVWISAPAGSGKTTLAASYLDFNEVPCLWYQLDERDIDPANFFYYTGLAAKNRMPGIHSTLPSLTPDYVPNIQVFARRFFEKLGTNLIGAGNLSAVPEKRWPVIVLDNYQEIPEDSPFHAIISAGIASFPRGITVIILSRNAPPSVYTRMLAAGEICLLGWEELRLSSDEFNAIVGLRTKADIPKKRISALYHTLDGWVAGLILLMESRGAKNIPSLFRHGPQRDEIFSYFAAEMFDGSSSEKQSFLLKTSFLAKMNAHMAESLTGNPEAGNIFAELNRKNYFTNSYSSREQSFQYHPLFQEFLRNKAETVLSSSQLRDIKIKTAKVLEENGYDEDVVYLLCEAGKWTEAIRIILAHAPKMVSRGRWQTLWNWMHALPEAERKNNAWFVFWTGVCLIHSTPKESKKNFRRAIEMFGKTDDAIGSFFSLTGLMETLVYNFDTFIEYDELIRLMNELLEKHPRYPSPEIEVRVTAAMFPAHFLRQPHSPTLKYWETRARKLIKKTSNPNAAGPLLCSLLNYYTICGETAKSKPDFDSLEKVVDPDQAPPIFVQMYRTLQAYYYWTTANFEKNQAAVRDGLARAEQTGVHFCDQFLLGHGAAGALSVGDMSLAGQYLDRMLAVNLNISSTLGEFLYYCLKGWQHLIEGNLTQASVHADLAMRDGYAMGSPLMMPYPYLLKAIVMNRLKEEGKALACLSGFWKLTDELSTFQVKFTAILLESHIAFIVGREGEGREYLRRAMAIGKKHHLLNGYFWDDRSMSNHCKKALEAGIQPDYVRNLIQRRHLVPESPVFSLEEWPWQLKIYTLGRFEIVLDGEVLTFSGKARQKPLALLKVIIALGGKDVRVEELCDILWPDADGDLAFRSFETTLYRLRRLIGKHEFVCFSQGRLTLDMQISWVDAFALEQVLGEAEKLWKIHRDSEHDPEFARRNAEQAVRLMQRAITLNKGLFLESELETAWLLSPRDRLRSKFIRGITSLAGYLAEKGKFETAVDYCETALETDELAEEIYQILMTMYTLLDQPVKVLSVYKRCKTVLWERLNMKPSSRTEAILMASRK